MSEPGRLSDATIKARNRRNAAIGLALAAFVAVVFVVTMVRLQQNVAAGSAERTAAAARAAQ